VQLLAEAGQTTAANVKFALEIAEHLRIFGKEVLASGAKTNLKGDAKLRIGQGRTIRALVERTLWSFSLP